MRKILTFSLALCVSLIHSAAARTFSVGDKTAAPASEVLVPVNLDDASGCASIQIAVNFDAQILEFVDFDYGTGLGAQFDPTAFAENGVVTLIWSRSASLLSGSGCLGWMRFRVNAGAEIGTVTTLAIANHETSDATGVTDSSLTSQVTAISGTLTVSGEPDTDRDGMPDSWETANLLDPLVSSGNNDTDQDGRSDFLEYASGGNPRVADPSRNPVAASHTTGDISYLALTFYRRTSSGLVYRVWESASLGSWDEVAIDTALTAPPLDQGDGTERLTVRSRFKMAGSGATPSGFMRLEVTKP